MVVLVLSEDSCSRGGGGGGETQTGGQSWPRGARGGGTSPGGLGRTPAGPDGAGGPRCPRGPRAPGTPPAMADAGDGGEGGQRYLGAVPGVMDYGTLRLLQEKGERQAGWGKREPGGDNDGGDDGLSSTWTGARRETQTGFGKGIERGERSRESLVQQSQMV